MNYQEIKEKLKHEQEIRRAQEKDSASAIQQIKKIENLEKKLEKEKQRLIDLTTNKNQNNQTQESEE